MIKSIDSPVSDRFISPAPGQPNIMWMGKQISINEKRQYYSVGSRNGVSLPTVTGPLKKIGTIGLFFRKVCNNNILQYIVMYPILAFKWNCQI